MHHIIFPLPLVLSLISPDVSATSLHAIVQELANKTAPVLPLKFTVAVLLATAVAADVDGAVRPALLALAVVFVVDPVTLIRGTIYVEVSSLPIRFVTLPVSDVDIAITMDDATKAFLLIMHKVAVIAGPIRPDLCPFAMTHATCPLARVLDL